MYRATLLLFIALIGQQLCCVRSQTTSTCNETLAVECGKNATVYAIETGCKFTLVLPEFESCVQSSTSGCGEESLQLWQNFITIIESSLTEELCYGNCPDQAILETSLSACQQQYGGLAFVTNEILSTGAISTSSLCTTSLKQIMMCMLNITDTCVTLRNSALNILYTEAEPALTRCNLVDRILTTTQQPFTPPDNATTTTANPSESEVLTAGTRSGLYVGLGVSSVFVLFTFIFIMVMWLRGERSANFFKGKLDSRATNTMNTADRGGQGKGVDDPNYFMRDRSPRRSKKYQYDYNDDEYDRFSQHSIGPYRPGGRWWTRPGFGTYGTDLARNKAF